MTRRDAILEGTQAAQRLHATIGTREAIEQGGSHGEGCRPDSERKTRNCKFPGRNGLELICPSKRPQRPATA